MGRIRRRLLTGLASTWSVSLMRHLGQKASVPLSSAAAALTLWRFGYASCLIVSISAYCRQRQPGLIHSVRVAAAVSAVCLMTILALYPSA